MWIMPAELVDMIGNLKRRYIRNINFHLNFFSERVINWWNSLENSAVCASSVNSFQTHLRRMWNKNHFTFG